MSKLLTKFKRNAIDSFLADVGSTNNYFVFVGGQTPYLTSDVPAESDSDIAVVGSWNEMMFGKKPTFARMTDKYVWTNDTVYTQYDDTVDLTSLEYYVVTSARDVFKCIYNNGGAASTIEPTKRAGKLGVPVKEEDGYEWLYLYTIPKSEYTKFTTNNYMPVFSNTMVQSAAVDGGLMHISVVSSGNSYPNATGLVANVASNSVFQLAAGANTSTNYYKDSSVAIIDNATKTTYVRKILSSNSSLWVTTEAFPNNFLSTVNSNYIIGPTVSITSDTGTGAVAYSIVDSGNVDKIELVSYGSGYRDALVTLTAGSGLGEGVSVRGIISPVGGHGSNVYDELHCDSLGVACLFDEWGVANSNFNADVTYRTVGILKNPLDVEGNSYTSDTFNQITTINIEESTGSGTFTLGETVRGVSSNSFGRFAFSNTTVVLLTGTNGIFVDNEEIVGDTSKARRTVSADSQSPDLEIYSGEILYIQNIQEVTRSVVNKEQVKLVISF